MKSNNDAHIDCLLRLAQRLRAGEPTGSAWKAELVGLNGEIELQSRVARILKTASALGAPVVTAVERVIQVEKHRMQSKAELDAEFAAPKATARLVSWLPAGFLTFAQVMGLPIFEAMRQSWLAKLSMSIGVLLLVFARVWSKRILKHAAPSALQHVDQLELVAIALHAGLGFGAALQKVGASADIAPLLTQERLLARATGAPVACLIEARVDSMADKQANLDRIRVREASIKLIWPLGAAVLPALILMLVVPLAVGFAGGMGG